MYKLKQCHCTFDIKVQLLSRWCAPCKALTPKLDSLVEESNGLLELAKVDVDTNSDLALEYEVSAKFLFLFYHQDITQLSYHYFNSRSLKFNGPSLQKYRCPIKE